ncbi:hypothetical protein V1478_017025 [Vespula squamosa]|uniref:Uncharacterized protein n=1 Tax=Vespula squamosa TaxID=30214 RepID=A0ABD1ZY75_VESSQ
MQERRHPEEAFFFLTLLPLPTLPSEVFSSSSHPTPRAFLHERVLLRPIATIGLIDKNKTNNYRNYCNNCHFISKQTINSTAMSTTALSGMQDGNKQMGALWKSDCTGILRRGTYDIKYLKCNARSGVRFSM